MPKQEVYTLDWTEGVWARYLRVQLLAHHGSNGQHTEVAENPNQVMFRALDGFSVFADGQAVKRVRVPNFQSQPSLKQIPVTPGSGPRNAGVATSVSFKENSNELVFSNRWMRMVFSRLPKTGVKPPPLGVGISARWPVRAKSFFDGSFCIRRHRAV